jgi:hypothetical protein
MLRWLPAPSKGPAIVELLTPDETYRMASPHATTAAPAVLRLASPAPSRAHTAFEVGVGGTTLEFLVMGPPPALVALTPPGWRLATRLPDGGVILVRARGRL